MRSDLYEIHVVLHHETEKAVLVSISGDRDKAVWLPKSLIELEPVEGKSVYNLIAREQFLIDKELI